MADPAASAGRTAVLTFRVGSEAMAVPAEAVIEVARLPRLTRVPYAPPALQGVANLRGRVTPVVSAAALLGREGQAAGDAARVIVLDLASPVGLAVDAVTALDTVEAGTGKAGRLFVREAAAVRVLDLEDLLQRGFAVAGRAGAGERARRAPEPRAEVAPVAERRLLGFEADGQLYALPLEAVEEAAAVPPGLAALPHGESADLGVVPFRGGLLPIISAAGLLGLTGAREVTGQKLVVVRLGAHRIGLAVDRLHAILRVPESAIGPAPAVLNRGGGEASIEAMARLEDGRSLAAVLSPERLFRRETVARLLEDAAQEDHQVSEDDSAAAAETVLVFRLGDEEYALPLASVDEVTRLPAQLTRVPRAPAFIEGVMNLRGEAVPVIDQTRRFGAQGAASDGRRVIVTRVGGLKAGFVVDAVSGIVALTADQIGEAPELIADERRTFDRVAALDDGARTILLVDPRALLDRAEADLLGAMTERAPAP